MQGSPSAGYGSLMRLLELTRLCGHSAAFEIALEGGSHQ